MNIYQIKFNYNYALADIQESIDGTNSLDLCAEKPNLISKFKYKWLTNESDVLPDYIIIMSKLLGCKLDIKQSIINLIPTLRLNPIKIANDDYVIFSNIRILSNCLNVKKSKITRFSNGDIMDIPIPVFLPEDYPILFKVEEIPFTYFCTQEFKNLLCSQSYTGLNFIEHKIKSKSWF